MAAVVEGRPLPVAVDGRADIFALGRLLREAIGAPGSAREGTGDRIAIRRSAAVSLGLSDLLQECLAPDPKDRYRDAAAMAEDLRCELNDLPLRGANSSAARPDEWTMG